VLQFFTGNIGLHHVHHLNPRIPSYNLQRAPDSSPMFAAMPAALALGRAPQRQTQSCEMSKPARW